MSSGVFQKGKAWGWAALLLLAIPVAAQAQFTYMTNNIYPLVMITGYTGSVGVVTIPSSINGLPVVRIGREAFFNNDILTDVTIPNSITHIEDGAFWVCQKLVRVKIGTGVTSIGECAFALTSLTNIVIPTGVTNIPHYAFGDCWRLARVSLPTSVEIIGREAFAGCTNLPSMLIPTNVYTIGTGAFSRCSTMTNIVIPDSVHIIQEYAFDSCLALTNVLLPRYVEQIGAGAFSWCEKLVEISVSTNNSNFASTNGVLFNKNKSKLVQYPAGISGDYLIPGGVTSIAGAAFGGCLHLTGTYFSGNAPGLVGSDWFTGATNATVYRLPGASGWPEVPEPWAGRPTALWLPETKADASLGVQEGKFGFNINWASGQTIVVEACTNLADPDWTPVGTNTFDGDSTYFSDSEWTNLPGRFYRLCMP